RNGPRCNCGNIGCWEAIASGVAIARRARERLAAGAPSVLRDMTGGALDKVDAALVAQAARGKDAVACALLKEVARDLGVGIVSLVHVFNPELVIIGGGVGRDWPLLRPVTEPYVRTHAMPVMRRRLKLVTSALGDDAGLVGAAALVFDREAAESGSSAV
ncbi:MAG: ROK family protein, partial [Chloroflexota bacterium]